MPQRALFRPEAIDFHQQQRHWGNTLILQPISTKLLSWCLILATAAVCVFVCFAPYARKQTVTGYLAPVGGTAKVFASRSGVIQDVSVKQGDMVRRGQPLLTVGTDQITADGKNVQDEELAVLHSQQRLLQQQIVSEEARERSEHDRLAATLQGTTTEMASLQAQIATQHDRIKLAEDLVVSATDLHKKGYLSNLEYNRRVANVLEEKQGVDSLNQQVLKLQNQIIETRATLDQLPTTMGDKVQLLRNELASTEEKISETNGQRAYTVRAPLAGEVSMLDANVGQAADPKRVLVEIVPRDSRLQAQLLVPSSAIGFVRVGERVRVMYDAFPYQHFGTYGGVVSGVSQTMLTGSEAGPIHLQEAAYKVTASLDRMDVDAQDRHMLLQPDMTLKADIILEKRPLVRWLLEPLLGTRM
jgi:membrane fusion protein